MFGKKHAKKYHRNNLKTINLKQNVTCNTHSKHLLYLYFSCILLLTEFTYNTYQL